MLRLVLIGLVVGAVSASNNKINIGGLLEMQLDHLNKLFTLQGMHQLTIGNASLGDLEAVGLRLTDLASLVRRGDAWLWTAPGSYIEATGTIGLANLTLSADDIIDSGKSLGKSVLTVDGSGIKFEQRTLITNNSCVQTYPILELIKVKSAILTNKDGNKDVTEMMNMMVISELNKYIKSDEFKQFVDFYLNQCRGMNNLKELIAKGTGEYIPAGVYLGSSNSTASSLLPTTALLLSALLYKAYF